MKTLYFWKCPRFECRECRPLPRHQPLVGKFCDAMVLDFRINNKEGYPGLGSPPSLEKAMEKTQEWGKSRSVSKHWMAMDGFFCCKKNAQNAQIQNSLDDPQLQEVRTTGYCEWELHPSVPSDLRPQISICLFSGNKISEPPQILRHVQFCPDLLHIEVLTI